MNKAVKDPAWFAIRTKPHKEQLALTNYEKQGFTVYLPRFKTVVRHARKRREVLKPFFPGYLFLRLTETEKNWSAISSTIGAIGPIRFGEHYIPVPNWIIDELRNQEDENGLISPKKIYEKQFAAGSRVEVVLSDQTSGAATVFSYDGENNIIVLLDILNRQVKVTVPVEQVRGT